MNCKGKAEWAWLLCRTEAYLNAGLMPHLTDAEWQSIGAHKATIKEWVYTDSILEMRPSAHHDWVGLGGAVVGFHPDREYRIQPKEDNSVEQYSKEFWQQCLNMHTMHLSSAIAMALTYNRDEIAEWVNGTAVEYFDDGKWVPVPKAHHRFTSKACRKAPPKPKQCDVVVYYRDAMQHGGRHSSFTTPAGIDVTRLPVEPTSEHSPTLDKLKAKTRGFKLLSITRVVLDENYNLMEYSTKLDNLSYRAPS